MRIGALPKILVTLLVASLIIVVLMSSNNLNIPSKNPNESNNVQSQSDNIFDLSDYKIYVIGYKENISVVATEFDLSSNETLKSLEHTNVSRNVLHNFILITPKLDNSWVGEVNEKTIVVLFGEWLRHDGNCRVLGVLASRTKFVVIINYHYPEVINTINELLKGRVDERNRRMLIEDMNNTYYTYLNWRTKTVYGTNEHYTVFSFILLIFCNDKISWWGSYTEGISESEIPDQIRLAIINSLNYIAENGIKECKV